MIDSRLIELNIIEPWEKGTEKSIKSEIVDKNADYYLIRLLEEYKLKDKATKYLLGELRDKKNEINLFDKSVRGTFLMNMVHHKNLNEDNFKDYDLEAFRSNFLMVELII